MWAEAKQLKHRLNSNHSDPHLFVGRKEKIVLLWVGVCFRPTNRIGENQHSRAQRFLKQHQLNKLVSLSKLCRANYLACSSCMFRIKFDTAGLNYKKRCEQLFKQLFNSGPGVVCRRKEKTLKWLLGALSIV
jgi:hypothetical protein